MSSGTTGAGRPARRSAGTWLRESMVAAARGLPFCGLMFAETGLIVVLAVELSLAIFWFPLLLIPGTLLAMRGLANRTRRLAGLCGVPIPVPYRPAPDVLGGQVSRWRRFGWLLTDQATWRDLLWAFLDPAVGWFLALLPAALVLYGLFGVLMPAVWSPIDQAGGNQWYGFIHVTNLATALLCVPLGLVFGSLGLGPAQRALRWYGLFAHSLLAPTRQAELALRVTHLARTRSEAVDTGAAEMRRIERDLHDGAQARLVAMGMTLSAAEQLLDHNPEAARALVLEARDASARALAELRDLVRGIHPPVLADRGLADAIRALALDSPLQIQIIGDLAGRLPAPVESAAYFAVSELLANVSKHAAARQVYIDIRYERGLLRVDVSDDGHGGADPSLGSGLLGIERRLAAFDGILALSSPPGGPTVVTMELPCALSSLKT